MSDGAAMASPASADGPVRVEQAVPDRDWLARAVDEEVIEPGLAVVDPHHHFSDHWGGYFGADLVADLGSGHAVLATVYVQCGHGYDHALGPDLAPVGETATALRIAGGVQHLAPDTRLCGGIVGFADLGLGREVDAVLAAHVEAGEGRFRGIRRSAARDDGFRYGVLAPPPVGLYADAKFRQGVSRLGRFDLSFDALCYHPQLGEFTGLAAALPGVRMVLNHTGMPLGVGPYRDRRHEVFRQWRESMRELARCDNVHVKLGGLGTAPCGFDFHAWPRPASSAELADAWRPYFETCIELFGAGRCMFESNFPVDKSGTSYRILWNAFKRIADGASEDEKLALFQRTAQACYGLAAS